MSHHDVIVVGAGLAGMTAAVRLAEAGARVLVLAKGVGATQLSGATIDVLGYAPERVDSPRAALASVPAEHPYARVGVEGVAAALAWFKERFGYVGSLDENLLLPTAIGVPKPTALVPPSMSSGDVRGGLPVLAVGFRELRDVHASLLADGLKSAGVTARALDLDVAPGERADNSSIGYARAFDSPGFLDEVVRAVRAEAGERVAFPAVLGLSTPAWEAVADKLGRPVFEVPTLPPSIPGLRLTSALRGALGRAGGTLRLNNVVVGAERSGSHVKALRVRVGLRVVPMGCDWVVLATGGFASGGLELSSRWEAREVALGLPVAGMPSGPRFSDRYFDEHGMSRVGIEVDGKLRPDGLENVVVAGATLAGAMPWKEKSGDGISLATGYMAAGVVAGARRVEVTA
jgi:glycerol-3-phosphate dehydrogenase subunit B